MKKLYLFIKYVKECWNRSEDGLLLFGGSIIQYRLNNNVSKKEDLELRMKINAHHLVLWLRHKWKWNWER